LKLVEKLIYLRKEKGLTQLELAEAMEVSRQAVSKWETGGALPSMENLLGLSKLYGVPADYLLDDGEEEIGKIESPPPETKEDLESSCKDTKKAAIKWGVIILIVLIILVLAASIEAIFANKSKEEPIWIDEMLGEEVNPNRSFSVEW